MQKSLTQAQGEEHKYLVLTRHQGLEHFLPDSSKWKVITTLKDECWVCSNHIIALYVWTPRIGLITMNKDEEETAYYAENLRKINGDQSVSERHSVPHFASENTAWKYKPMFDIRELCQERDT